VVHRHVQDVIVLGELKHRAAQQRRNGQVEGRHLLGHPVASPRQRLGLVGGIAAQDPERHLDGGGDADLGSAVGRTGEMHAQHVVARDDVVKGGDERVDPQRPGEPGGLPHHVGVRAGLEMLHEP
jgi:hypothetical protein